MMSNSAMSEVAGSHRINSDYDKAVYVLGNILGVGRWV